MAGRYASGPVRAIALKPLAGRTSADDQGRLAVDEALQARRHVTPFKPEAAQDFLYGFALICTILIKH